MAFRSIGALFATLFLCVSIQAETAAITLDTNDGARIAGTLYKGTLAKGIVCLHMLGGDRSQYAELAKVLQTDGYNVLAIDLRGHGQSRVPGEEDRRWREFTPVDFQLMAEDLRAAIRFLKEEVGMREQDVGVIGASIGASVALEYASKNRGVRTLVLLSPGFNYRGLLSIPAAKKLGGLSLLLVAGKDDDYAARSAEALEDATGVPRKLEIYEQAGHGTRMLTTHPELVDGIRKWMDLWMVVAEGKANGDAEGETNAD